MPPIRLDWRAANSLQLDETIGLYCARLTGEEKHLATTDGTLTSQTIVRVGPQFTATGTTGNPVAAARLATPCL